MQGAKRVANTKCHRPQQPSNIPSERFIQPSIDPRVERTVCISKKERDSLHSRIRPQVTEIFYQPQNLGRSHKHREYEHYCREHLQQGSRLSQAFHDRFLVVRFGGGTETWRWRIFSRSSD